MNLEKLLLAWWNSFICFLFGHSLTNVCTRCGKVVNLLGAKPQTLEERINGYFARRKALKKAPEYKGSLKIKNSLNKYSINMKTNVLMLVEYEKVYEPNENGKGLKLKQRKAKFDPLLVYIDASNDQNAIRKANDYLFGIKKGVKITHVTTPEMLAQKATTTTI